MKNRKLAKILIKDLVKEYKKSDRDGFDFDYFIEKYPECSEEQIKSTIYLLGNDGLVSIFNADNIPYFTTLTVEGIRYVENNTVWKKFYALLKEIRDWIPFIGKGSGTQS